MTWSFRRSLQQAPAPDPTSPGVAASGDVRGARASSGAPGTFVSLGPRGFQYSEIPDHAGATAGDPSGVLAGASGFIHSASASELALRDPEVFIHDTEQRLRRPDLFLWYVAASLVLAVYASAAHPVLGVVCIVVAGVPARKIYRWNRARRTTRICYDINDAAIMERLVLANAAGRSLAQASRLWHIFYAERTSDWKRNAGAQTLIRRTPTRAVAGSLPQIELNIEPWCVPVGPQKLLFLPDRLFVWDNTRLVGLPYEDLSVSAGSARYIEDEAVPRDARQVDTTWRYVNKKGGPDRRFANNKQLPVLEYGKIELSSAGGLRVVLQTSIPEAVAGVQQALSALVRPPTARPIPRAENSIKKSVPTRPPAPVMSAPHHAPEQAEADGTAARSVAILLRHVASADRRISGDEVAFALAVLSRMPHGGSIRVVDFDAWFRSLPADTNSVDMAVATICTLGEDKCRWVVEVLGQLTGADGRATPKELERQRELAGRLLSQRSSTHA